MPIDNWSRGIRRRLLVERIYKSLHQTLSIEMEVSTSEQFVNFSSTPPFRVKNEGEPNMHAQLRDLSHHQSSSEMLTLREQRLMDELLTARQELACLRRSNSLVEPETGASTSSTGTDQLYRRQSQMTRQQHQQQQQHQERFSAGSTSTTMTSDFHRRYQSQSDLHPTGYLKDYTFIHILLHIR
ncbi:unnamed protein product [Protopolystoma xenopodis]|uniref:Uncharacterized protein n=1 Tax=Protopolystoma xenopodis TaxID=117903 RepID=A0A448X283_9PLAT|nr:unnamed protein product [Protopolystoma xenopodis]